MKKGLKTIVAAVLALAFAVLAGCGNATRFAVEGVPETVLTAPKANGADSAKLSAPFFLSFRRSTGRAGLRLKAGTGPAYGGPV